MSAAWKGDSAGHARAGRLGGKAKRKSDPGNFKSNPKRASEAGRKGAEEKWGVRKRPENMPFAGEETT